MTKIVKHHYTACGLPNIWVQCRSVLDDAGNQTFIISNIRGLHKAIAHTIVHSDGALTGPELKFLRSEMGLTQAQLGELVHRTRLTISRWESGKSTLDGAADTLIRIFASDKLRLDGIDAEEISGKYKLTDSKSSIRINLDEGLAAVA